jgi:hypothetical protein
MVDRGLSRSYARAREISASETPARFLHRSVIETPRDNLPVGQLCELSANHHSASLIGQVMKQAVIR